MRPLSWGLHDHEINKLYPNVHIGDSSTGRYLAYAGCSLHNLQGDCGSLLLCGANKAQKETLDILVDIASRSGFNKIFATVVTYPENAAKAVKAFKQKRFILVASGKSNRNDDKEDYVFVKYIRKCKYKGY